MNAQLQTQAKSSPDAALSFTPVQTKLLHRKCACGGTPGLDGDCAECRRKHLQRRGTNQAEPSPVSSTVQEALSSPGHPLESEARAFLEPRFGHDFSRVRIHTDVKAAESARRVNALAYTAAEQQFGSQAGMPGESSAAPVVQAKLEISRPGDVYEQEANRMAEQVMRMPEAQLRPAQLSHVQTAHPADEETLRRLSVSALDFSEKEEEEEEKQEGETIQAKTLPGYSPTITLGLESCVHRLRGAGQSLPTSIRTFFEPRFGYDFSQVRVHSGALAAEATQTAQARAFTVGRDIVFASGQYAPATSEGQRLLAHELTHVIQQGKADSSAQVQAGAPVVQRAPIGGDEPSPPMSHGGTLPYREATELLACIRIMGEENADYCRQQALGEQQQPTLQPLPEVCEPNRRLTWADFTGTPPAGQFGAATHSRHDLVTDQGQQIIRAFFQPASSWVRPQFANPTNRAVNECASRVGSCERFFDNEAAAGRTGAWWRLTAPTGCAASIAADPSMVATSRNECSSTIGPECDRVAALESARLLRHEQVHFDIACVLARKGTDALALRPANQAQTILAAVRQRANQLSSSAGQYDTQTTHGCNAAAQASWESDVQSGLPAVTIP